MQNHFASTKFLAALGFAAVVMVTAGCASPPSNPLALAVVRPTQGHSANGFVLFSTTRDDKLRIQGTIKGLAPNTQHGFHIHDKGECDGINALSAGGHFNPTNQPHGAYDGRGSGAHHAGDLPPLLADAQGRATFDFALPGLSLKDGPNNIVNRSVIVHQEPDDFTTQPAGNSGARIGCGVIGM